MCIICHSFQFLTEYFFRSGIYSARMNLDKRMAIRNTWLKAVTARNIKYKFFLGKNGIDIEDDSRLVREEIRKSKKRIFFFFFLNFI